MFGVFLGGSAYARSAPSLVLRFDDNKSVSQWREVAEIFEAVGGRTIRRLSTPSDSAGSSMCRLRNGSTASARIVAGISSSGGRHRSALISGDDGRRIRLPSARLSFWMTRRSSRQRIFSAHRPGQRFLGSGLMGFLHHARGSVLGGGRRLSTGGG